MAETVKYEMMVIIKPDLNQKQTEEELKKLRDFIKSQEGSITHEDLWGMQKLAYTIKKYSNGYYAIFYFDLPPTEVKELMRNIKLEQNIMRSLIMKTPEDYEIKEMEDFEFEELGVRPPSHKNDKDNKRTSYSKSASKAPAKKVATKPEAEKKEKKPVKKTVKKESKKVEEKKDDKKEESKDKKGNKGAKLEAIDEKLQSIIDDPDTLKI